MKTTGLRKIRAALFMIAALLCALCACGKPPSPPAAGAESETVSANDAVSGETDAAERSFTLTVIHANGTEKEFRIATGASTVGEALRAENLIAGEPGPYGLYVRTVDGETLDYDEDGMYWAFYLEDTYAATGVDQTAVQPGANYTLKAERG